MNNSVDILYYESMIDSTIEDRKIMELIMNSEYNNILLKENAEELVIYEANIFTTIIESIVKIFQKTIDFIKSIIEKITGKLIFKLDKKLVNACHEKIKSLTREQKDSFKMEYNDVFDTTFPNKTWATLTYQNFEKRLIEYYNVAERFLANTSRDGKNNLPDSAYEKFLSEVEEFNKILESKSKIEKKQKTMDFDIVRSRLNKYIESEKTLESLNVDLKKTIKDMKTFQNYMNLVSKNNRETIIGRKYDQKELVKYRNLIQNITTCIIKLCKFRFNMNILEFRNNEYVLRKFLNYSFNNDEENSNTGDIKLLTASESAFSDEYFY